MAGEAVDISKEGESIKEELEEVEVIETEEMETIELLCHNCGIKYTFEKIPKEFVCTECGAVNTVPREMSSEEPLGCLPPTGFEWTMPAGKIGNPVVGYKYVTAQGNHLSKDEYITTFGLDPDIALEYMRKTNK